MVTPDTALRGAIVLWCLWWGTSAGRAEPHDIDEASTASPPKIDNTLPARSLNLRPVPLGQGPQNPLSRMLQHRHEIETQRRQRKIELEATRKVRKAERAAWLKRWEEQRRLAREQSLKRERQYHRELAERFPELAEHRRRHVEELERRRQALEKGRQARWRALDALKY